MPDYMVYATLRWFLIRQAVDAFIWERRVPVIRAWLQQERGRA